MRGARKRGRGDSGHSSCEALQVTLPLRLLELCVALYTGAKGTVQGVAAAQKEESKDVNVVIEKTKTHVDLLIRGLGVMQFFEDRWHCCLASVSCMTDAEGGGSPSDRHVSDTAAKSTAQTAKPVTSPNDDHMVDDTHRQPQTRASTKRLTKKVTGEVVERKTVLDTTQKYETEKAVVKSKEIPRRERRRACLSGGGALRERAGKHGTRVRTESHLSSTDEDQTHIVARCKVEDCEAAEASVPVASGVDTKNQGGEELKATRNVDRSSASGAAKVEVEDMCLSLDVVPIETGGKEKVDDDDDGIRRNGQDRPRLPVQEKESARIIPALCRPVDGVHSVKGDQFTEWCGLKEEDKHQQNENEVEVKWKRKSTPKFQCPICPECFSLETSLFSHVKTCHEADDNFKSVMFEMDEKYYCPKKQPQNETGSSCLYCARKRVGKRYIVRHMENCHSDEPGLKEALSKLVSSLNVPSSRAKGMEKYARENRRRKEEGKGYKCKHCGRLYPFRGSRCRHERFMCPENPERQKLNRCTTCTKTFLARTDLEAHVAEAHGGGGAQYVCETCGKIYQTSSALTVHTRNLHRIAVRKPINLYSCKVCQKEFYQKHQWARHELSHFDAKNAQCEMCGKQFKCMADVKRHQKTVHENCYLYHCSKCGHGMSKKKYLDSHRCGKVRRNQAQEEEEEEQVADGELAHKAGASSDELAQVEMQFNAGKPAHPVKPEPVFVEVVETKMPSPQLPRDSLFLQQQLPQQQQPIRGQPGASHQTVGWLTNPAADHIYVSLDAGLQPPDAAMDVPPQGTSQMIPYMPCDASSVVCIPAASSSGNLLQGTCSNVTEAGSLTTTHVTVAYAQSPDDAGAARYTLSPLAPVMQNPVTGRSQADQTDRFLLQEHVVTDTGVVMSVDGTELVAQSDVDNAIYLPDTADATRIIQSYQGLEAGGGCQGNSMVLHAEEAAGFPDHQIQVMGEGTPHY